jgi:hypothetical protein
MKDTGQDDSLEQEEKFKDELNENEEDEDNS